jgi:hypothetical protein
MVSTSGCSRGAPDAPALGRDDDNARTLSLPPLNLLAPLRVRQDEVMAKLLLARHYLRNVRSLIRS